MNNQAFELGNTHAKQGSENSNPFNPGERLWHLYERGYEWGTPVSPFPKRSA